MLHLLRKFSSVAINSKSMSMFRSYWNKSIWYCKQIYG